MHTTTLTSFDPSNGEPVGEVPVTPVDAISGMIGNAQKAAKSWRKLSVAERAQLISQAYAQAQPHMEELAILLSREMGKDIRRSSGEVQGTVMSVAYRLESIAAALKSQRVSSQSRVEYRPLGVAAIISPWNYPLAMANNLLLPALLAGNTVLLKPSEQTPLVAHEFVGHLNKVLPEHVLQIVHGDGEQGRALVDSKVNLIGFTGSMAVGKDIMARASGSLKRLVMELGGNDPMIVMHNADLDAAARFAVASSFENAGQMCTSNERIYVDERVAQDFEEKVVSIAQRYVTGPWNQNNVNIGPIVSQKQHQHIKAHIADAQTRGARVLLGEQQDDPHYIQPTVIADMSRDMRLEQEETFGPVVAMSRYQNLDEAIERANDTDYGLGAIVFGGQGADQVAAQLEAGMIGINQGVGGSGDAPWVGAKQSGFGFHGSSEGHRQFAQVCVVNDYNSTSNQSIKYGLRP